MGKFVKWLLESESQTVFGMKLPTGFQLIGQTTLAEYEHWLRYFEEQRRVEEEGRRSGRRVGRRIDKRAYARIGVRKEGKLFVDVRLCSFPYIVFNFFYYCGDSIL